MQRDVHRLSGRQYAIVYAIAIGTFLLVNGPVWRHPFDLDSSIVWSYLIIPVLVAGCLLWSRKLGLLSLVTNTIEAVVVKFGVTYMGALALWIGSGGPPPQVAEAAPPPRETVVETRLEGTPIAVENAGRGFGAVTARAGQPLALRSTDGRLHTFRVYDADGAVVSNHAVPPGAVTTIALPEPMRGSIGCAVHANEPRAPLEIR
jgi:hypothetical protein